MKPTIKIGKTELILDPLIIQTSPTGRSLRLSGTRINGQVQQKWINGTFKSHIIHDFIYTDEKGGFVSFEFDYENKFIKKL